MKRAAVIFYTDRGEATAARITDALRDEYALERYRAKCDVGELFNAVDALIFVGACGIAVRSIAPFIRSKTSDPAVIVIDERGQYAISLLSGHIGGANGLTKRIAQVVGATPVITTATDVNGRFAADEWASRNGLVIASMQSAKRFAAEILQRDLPVHSDFPILGKLPYGLYRGEEGAVGLSISCRKCAPFAETLKLIPKKLYLGVGCRRGTASERIHAAALQVLEAEGFLSEAVAEVASIDVKRDETGLLEFRREGKLPLRFYSAQELMQAQGEFSASAFVQSTVGVDNVCERAAMLAAGKNAELMVKKTCLDGVTIAVAQAEWSVRFE